MDVAESEKVFGSDPFGDLAAHGITWNTDGHPAPRRARPARDRQRLAVGGVTTVDRRTLFAAAGATAAPLHFTGAASTGTVSLRPFCTSTISATPSTGACR